MKRPFWLLIASVVFGLSFFAHAWAETPVVVELFTAEGCSSCPPADALLVQLGRQSPAGVDLILLGEHVDYWNHDGWVDRFSSAQLTQRQSNYEERLHVAAAYTPQIVIDGHVQLVGNDVDALKNNLELASKQAKVAQVTLQWEAGDQLKIAVQAPDKTHAHIFLAVTEDGLTSSISGGENNGKTLQHAAVVRDLHDVGSMKGATFEKTVKVPQHSGWNPANLKVAVLVQSSDPGPILGAASTRFQSVTAAAQ
jgi:hypothetical protein